MVTLTSQTVHFILMRFYPAGSIFERCWWMMLKYPACTSAPSPKRDSFTECMQLNLQGTLTTIIRLQELVYYLLNRGFSKTEKNCSLKILSSCLQHVREAQLLKTALLRPPEFIGSHLLEPSFLSSLSCMARACCTGWKIF